MNKIIIATIAILIVGCKSQKVVEQQQETITKVVREVIHDTIFKIEKDKSAYKALLKCQNQKVIVVHDTVYKGKYLPAPKVVIQKDNTISCDCETEARQLFAQWKSQHTEVVKEKVIRVPYKVEKQLSWWQKTHIALGKILLVLLIAGVAYGIYRIKSPMTWIKSFKR